MNNKPETSNAHGQTIREKAGVIASVSAGAATFNGVMREGIDATIKGDLMDKFGVSSEIGSKVAKHTHQGDLEKLLDKGGILLGSVAGIFGVAKGAMKISEGRHIQSGGVGNEPNTRTGEGVAKVVSGIGSIAQGTLTTAHSIALAKADAVANGTAPALGKTAEFLSKSVIVKKGLPIIGMTVEGIEAFGYAQDQGTLEKEGLKNAAAQKGNQAFTKGLGAIAVPTLALGVEALAVGAVGMTAGPAALVGATVLIGGSYVLDKISEHFGHKAEIAEKHERELLAKSKATGKSVEQLEREETNARIAPVANVVIQPSAEDMKNKMLAKNTTGAETGKALAMK